ncbi:MAG: urease accessory protein UreF [Thiohalocapsa sp.]|nr:urease accessory protein UreF [Thiohalocapsa sp.]MCF7991559.1 urease accessory protein UreF [Thiohalocapsa sp.]
MATTTDHLPAAPALLRLLQLVSPSLPVGGYSYSGGIEWAVEAGWIRNARDTREWLSDLLAQSLCRVDLPLLARMQAAAGADDVDAMAGWIELLHALRETAELRAEEAARGRALADLMVSLDMLDAGAGSDWRGLLARSQLAAFGYAGAAWRIPGAELLQGYSWNWLEGQALAAVKIVPLGQTEGQRLLSALAAEIPVAIETALGLDDDRIGASTPALAIASSNHETQYTRLFRS